VIRRSTTRGVGAVAYPCINAGIPVTETHLQAETMPEGLPSITLRQVHVPRFPDAEPWGPDET